MNTASESFFVAAPATNAYREWKTFVGFPENGTPGRNHLTVLADQEDRELHWRTRWGVFEIEGQADFIPAQGGCILYVKYAGLGFVPRFFLAVQRPSVGFTSAAHGRAVSNGYAPKPNGAVEEARP
jgi:hypothetical protein